MEKNHDIQSNGQTSSNLNRGDYDFRAISIDDKKTAE